MFPSKLSFETVFILVFPGIAQYFPLMPEFAWRYLPVNTGISQGRKNRPTLTFKDINSLCGWMHACLLGCAKKKLFLSDQFETSGEFSLGMDY